MSKTESFEFLNELALAFRRGEKNARPQHTPILEGVRAVLAHLTAAGRLLADDEMRLTAEQVEDVRTAREELRGYRNFDGYARPYVNRLVEVVGALFPATEPAEERRSFPTIQDVPNNTLFHTHGGGGSSLFVRNRFGELRLSLGASQYWSKPMMESDFLPSSGPFVEVPWPELPQPPADPFAQPAPAEPAEEETKAEAVEAAINTWVETAYQTTFAGLGHSDTELAAKKAIGEMRHLHLAEPWLLAKRITDILAGDTASGAAPVAPAPTETGPWQTVKSDG